jgi:ribonuclease P protein component
MVFGRECGPRTVRQSSSEDAPAGVRPSRSPFLPNKPVLAAQTRRCEFPVVKRLRASREYRIVREHGRKEASRHFLVFLCKKETGPSRLGLTVSRKIGGAVQRNRVKRMVREFFRTHYHELPSCTDFSVIARKGAAELKYGQVCRELEFLRE